MSRNTGDKANYSKKIIKLLADKPAISVATLTEQLGDTDAPKALYALTRSLKGLRDTGLVEHHHSGQQAYARLTAEGKRKAHSIKLDHEDVVFNPHWDGKWRIIMLDFPEDRKTERDALRYLLKKAGFVAAKNSVWISKLPFEHLFANIKKDLGLKTEVMILVTDALDIETEKEFVNMVQ